MKNANITFENGRATAGVQQSDIMVDGAVVGMAVKMVGSSACTIFSHTFGMDGAKFATESDAAEAIMIESCILIAKSCQYYSEIPANLEGRVIEWETVCHNKWWRKNGLYITASYAKSGKPLFTVRSAYTLEHIAACKTLEGAVKSARAFLAGAKRGVALLAS